MIAEADLQGHWRREWIRAPGIEDTTTRVHWLQAGALYADIRVPLDRPDLAGAACLEDLPAVCLLALMRAEGFAGTIDVAGGVCTWTREINWHGTPDTVDAGRMRFDTDCALIEDGVHADYRELWRHIPGPPLTATRVVAGDLAGILVQSDTLFLLAMGDPAALPTTQIRDALAHGDRPEGLARHFATGYALGHWDGATGIADLSTNPFDEGIPVLEKTQAGLILLGHAVGGPRAAERLRLDAPALHLA